MENFHFSTVIGKPRALSSIRIKNREGFGGKIRDPFPKKFLHCLKVIANDFLQDFMPSSDNGSH